MLCEVHSDAKRRRRLAAWDWTGVAFGKDHRMLIREVIFPCGFCLEDFVGITARVITSLRGARVTVVMMLGSLFFRAKRLGATRYRACN